MAKSLEEATEKLKLDQIAIVINEKTVKQEMQK